MEDDPFHFKSLIFSYLFDISLYYLTFSYFDPPFPFLIISLPNLYVGVCI